MQKRTEDYFDRVPVIEARWGLICAVVVAAIWLWPSDLGDAVLAWGVSVLKALGWLVGITLAVFLSSVLLSAIGEIILKGTRPRPESETRDSER